FTLRSKKMGFLDNAVNKSAPQGSSLAKPLLLAFGALLASGALTRKPAPTPAPASAPGTNPAAADPQAGGLLGGLGGLLEKFQQSGQGDVAKSWVASGPNQPIEPGQLGSALGPSLIKTLAEKTGLSEQDVTGQLSKILPAFVDKLTPQGRVPTHDEISRFAA
ncbi:MAG: YidB family protein, partial [Pseudolabrys sp.]